MVSGCLKVVVEVLEGVLGYFKEAIEFPDGSPDVLRGVIHLVIL